MSWSMYEVGSMLKLAETGQLAPDQLERAGRQAPLAPSREGWLAAFDRLSAFAGALLLGAAVVFFFAYNWSELDRFARLGVATTAVTGCVGVALFTRPFSAAYRAALLGACITTGALLALIGQTYQTGADIWELFAAWAALMLPFALLARSSASWALWLVVANAALLRALSQSTWFGFAGALFDPQSLFMVAGLNLVILLVFEAFGTRLLADPRRHLHRLAAAGMLIPLAFGAIVGWWEEQFLATTAAFVLAAGVAVWVYHRPHRDLPMVALALCLSIAVLSSALVRYLPGDANFLATNLVALFVIGSSTLAALWIRRLHQDEHAS